MNWQAISRTRWALAAIWLALIVLAWWQVGAASRGLTVEASTVEGVPLRVVVPETDSAETLPGVLIAHGFAGSQQLMLGFANVFAQAGYGVVVWDFSGHGANPSPLDSDSLQRDLDVAYRTLAADPRIDSDRIGLLGHSMGSGAVMTAGIEQAERYRATVAVSPTDADVSAELPPNLLLMAGTLEPPFVANAERLLAAAGGSNDDMAGGLARKLVLISAVEHITILFSAQAHAEAMDWLGQALAATRVPTTSDTRMLWVGLHLLGWVGLALTLAPAVVRPPEPDVRRRPWHWLGMLLGAVAASAVMWLLQFVVNLSELGGLLVGIGVADWFGAVGLVVVVSGFRVARTRGRDGAWALALFAVLWLAFGALSQIVWLPWLLNPPRLLRWLPVALLMLPSQLAWGLLTQRTGGWQKLGWWAVQSLVISVGLAAVLLLVPGFTFLALILPLVPIVYGVMGLLDGVVARPWAIGVGNALFFAWLLVAVFPLA